MSDLYRRAISSAVALVCGALSSSVPAALVPYTDRSAFDAAVAALPNVSRVAEGYDGATAGELIGNGATLRGLTYTYGASGNNLEGSGVWMKVSTGFGTTSPPNFLGTSDGGVFQSGDNFSLGFGAARAIGMYFISNDSLFDGDITLSAGAATASLLVADIQPFNLADGNVYFLGLVDYTASFTAVSINSFCTPCGSFLFNVDDVVTATIPEPSTLALLVLGMIGLRPFFAVGRVGKSRNGPGAN